VDFTTESGANLRALLQPLLLIYHIILKYSRVSVSLKSTKARLYSEQALFTTKTAAEQASFNAAWRLF